MSAYLAYWQYLLIRRCKQSIVTTVSVFFKDSDPVEHGEASMTVPGKKATLLVGFIFILLVPPLASGKNTQSGADDGIFLSRYQEPYQNAFYILIPKGWQAEGVLQGHHRPDRNLRSRIGKIKVSADVQPCLHRRSGKLFPAGLR
jgi:hypothetical protein